MTEASGAAPIDIATRTHAGLAGRPNQDFFLHERSMGLSIVADGVGGQGDGGWASRRAIGLLAEKLAQTGQTGNPEAVIGDILQAVNEAMLRENLASGRPASGTTIAGLWAPGLPASCALVFNVGDSAVYHLGGRGLAKVSKDHSLYQLWLDGGCAGTAPARRVIVQAVGISETLSPHIARVGVRPGEKVLLCTDGLAPVSLRRMTSLLAAAGGPGEACDALLAAALEGPARDNITVSVCNF